jgi:NADH-quinone oxidoreductase subunit E
MGKGTCCNSKDIKDQDTGCITASSPFLEPESPEWQQFVEVVNSYKGKKGAVIPVLQKAQAIFNYIPEKVVDYISAELGIPTSALSGVITFYAQFYTELRGRHVIRVCRGTACHVRGGKSVLRAVEDHLGITEGQSTPDMRFTLETVACLGTCALAPVMIIDQNYYGNLSPTKIIDILKGYSEEIEN